MGVRLKRCLIWIFRSQSIVFVWCCLMLERSSRMKATARFPSAKSILFSMQLRSTAFLVLVAGSLFSTRECNRSASIIFLKPLRATASQRARRALSTVPTRCARTRFCCTTWRLVAWPTAPTRSSSPPPTCATHAAPATASTCRQSEKAPSSLWPLLEFRGASPPHIPTRFHRTSLTSTRDRTPLLSLQTLSINASHSSLSLVYLFAFTYFLMCRYTHTRTYSKFVWSCE